MTRKRSLEADRLLDRLWLGGCILASHARAEVVNPLIKAGLIEHASVNGLLTIRLSYEGLYYLGATHEDIEFDAAYWRARHR